MSDMQPMQTDETTKPMPPMVIDGCRCRRGTDDDADGHMEMMGNRCGQETRHPSRGTDQEFLSGVVVR